MIIIFPDLPAVEVEGVEEAEEITLILRTTSPTASLPLVWGCIFAHPKSLYKDTARPSFYRASNPSHYAMYVVFSVKTTPALKKSLLSDFQISVIPMHNAQNGCNTLSVGLGSK